MSKWSGRVSRFRVIPSTRSRRSPVDRFDERRNELAESALLTLGELGYARTSLRDIASNSPFSHGVLHYYFADKLELVSTASPTTRCAA